MTVELFSGTVALRDPQDIAYHVELFETFRSQAYQGFDAIEFLRVIADDFRREQRSGHQ